jgi:SAM-dependent methyltransferase
VDDALYRLHAEREESYWWWVAKNRIILSLVDRYAPKPVSGRARRALDIGCGAGAVLDRLSRSFDALGVDSSPLAREYCARRHLRALDGSLPNALPAEITDQRRPFDCIVLSEVIEHVPEDSASIRTVAGLLRPGGILVCTVPAHMWLWSSHDDFNHHQRRYSLSGFSSLFNELPLEPIVRSPYQCASMPLLLATRLGERFARAIGRPAPKEPSVRPLPRPINAVLRAAFEAEKHWLPHARLPWGSSIITVHRRRADASTGD